MLVSDEKRKPQRTIRAMRKKTTNYNNSNCANRKDLKSDKNANK